MPDPDFDAWARETPEPTPGARLAAQLDTAAAAGEDLCILLAPEIADARALLRERDELAEKLAVAMRTVASLAAQRDSMETALNKANQELHVITRCGDTFEAFFGAPTSKPCIRESAHLGSHCNADGTRWFFNAPEDARDDHTEQQVTADLRAARDMFRRPEQAGSVVHFSPGYDGEKPDHHGPADTCAMPACRKANLQRAAADAIQDLTLDYLANRDPQ